MIEHIQVKLFTLHRPLKGNPITSVGPRFTTHWALLIEYYENQELDCEEIVEGFRVLELDNSCSVAILEVRQAPYGIKKKKEFESKPGQSRIALQNIEEFLFYQDNVLFPGFVKIITRKRRFTI